MSIDNCFCKLDYFEVIFSRFLIISFFHLWLERQLFLYLQLCHHLYHHLYLFHLWLYRHFWALMFQLSFSPFLFLWLFFSSLSLASFSLAFLLGTRPRSSRTSSSSSDTSPYSQMCLRVFFPTSSN